jgi:hypothetical protein
MNIKSPFDAKGRSLERKISMNNEDSERPIEVPRKTSAKYKEVYDSMTDFGTPNNAKFNSR